MPILSFKQSSKWVSCFKWKHSIFHKIYIWFSCVWFWYDFIIICCGFRRLIFPSPSRSIHWHWGNLTIAPEPMNQPWRIWVNLSGTKPQQSIIRVHKSRDVWLSLLAHTLKTIWQLCRLWHSRLSQWQLPVPPVKSKSWHHDDSRFSIYHW